jgi:hypothetical protein
MAEGKSTDSGEDVIFDGLLFGVELDVVGNDPSR